MPSLTEDEDRRKKNNLDNLAYFNYLDSVKEVAKELNLYEEDVKKIYVSVMRRNVNHLFHADEYQDVEVRLIEGLIVGAYFIPSHLHEHPRTKEILMIEDKIKLRFRFTRPFKETMDRTFAEQRKTWKEFLKSKNRENQVSKKDIEVYRKLKEEEALNKAVEESK